jgi:hypothetical protein
MDDNTVKINRAPVMTLWAAVVAERLGFDEEESLSLGRGVAGLNAQSKGRRLGIFEPTKESGEQARQRERDEDFAVSLLGRPVPARNTDKGVRAVNEGRPIDPGSVQRYLGSKNKDDLILVREAMRELADSYEPEELAGKAYDLYEQIRPEIPEGKKGWGAFGNLSIKKIRALQKSSR